MKLILMLLLVGGCSSASMMLDQKDFLPYKESSQISKRSEKLKPISIIKIDDKRESDTFGYAYTGVQYQKTPLYLNKDFSAFMTDYIGDSLALRNIVVTDEVKEIPLIIEVKELWVEEVIEKFQPEKARCKVDMSFHIITDEKKWSGEYWTEFTSGGDLSDGTERLAPTLASCMNELVEKLVNDDKFISMLK